MRRVHRLAPQCDMLEPVRPRRSKVFLEWQDLRNKEPTQGPSPKSKDRLHIWQKVNRDRDLNILEDYYWFYEEWDRINNRFLKSFNKTFPELLMERIHHYRIKMENSMLVAACILTPSERENDDPNKWMKSLRKYPGEPMARGTPKCPWDEGRATASSATLNDTKKEVTTTDRIGRADRDPPKFEYFNDQGAHFGKKQENWSAWEKFCFEMAAALEDLEPHYPDFRGLLVYGRQLKPPLSQHCPKPSICNDPRMQPKEPSSILGPAATISSTYCFILNQVGEQSKRTVTLKNWGETVLFYTWKRRPMESLITTSEVCLGSHTTNCCLFSIVSSSGSIQSKEVKQFDFIFKSNAPGVFLESWVICVAPKLPVPWTLDPVFFKGVAISKDHVEKLGERLSRILQYSEMTSGIDEFVMDMLNQAAKASHPTKEMLCAREYMFSHEAFNFLQRNLDIAPRVYYAPTLYKRIEALAMVVKAWEPSVPGQPLISWDGSFSSITTGIEQAAMSERMKKHFLTEVEALRESAQIPPDHSMLFHAAMYKMLKEMADRTGDVINQTPPAFGTPPLEKVERDPPLHEDPAVGSTGKRLKATKAQAMEMSSSRTHSDKASSDAFCLESREDIQEMCFKWLHICSEMRLYWAKGIHDYEEQLSNEQNNLKGLINQRIAELASFADETSSWDRFALERAKQQLIQEESNTE